MKGFESILITGGTGSFGKALVRNLLKLEVNKLKKIIIFSRDELKQWELQKIYPREKYPQLRFFLGDVRDLDRLKLALENIDVVVHAAALKQVPAAEYNPMEFIKTNVVGADNLVRACLSSGVKKVIALSTDKAAAPINLYGASKLCADKLFIAANNLVGTRDLIFSVVRYGNVMGSRGSVFPFFLEKASSGILPITDKSMTRFNISLQKGVEMVLWALDKSLGGEIFIPKIPSYRILDVAEAIGPKCKIKIIGIRPGEKIHEEMITVADSKSAYDLGKYYVILPSDGSVYDKYLAKNKKLLKVPDGFSYNSGVNEKFLSVKEIRNLIIQNLDPEFIPF